MKIPLEICFGKSTSQMLPRAIKLASSLPGYGKQGEGRDERHQVKLEVGVTEDAMWKRLGTLLNMVGGWRSASIEVAGEEFSPWELTFNVARVKECYGDKLRQGAGDEYCSGKSSPEGEHDDAFGCRRCLEVSAAIQSAYYDGDRSWTQYGKLSPDQKSFQVGKKEILKVLEEQAQENLCVYCPAYSAKRLRADVAKLPDVIDLTKDTRFELRYALADPAKAVGIRAKPSPDEDDDDDDAPQAASVRQVPQVRYSDIAGQDAALQQVKNIVQLPLTHAEYFTALGVEPQAGVILYGPPGNGKTLIAKALACECQAHLEIINGPEVLSKWVGESEANLRRVFERARRFAPSVVLIDELDSLAPQRETMPFHHDVQVISQLLVLLDGLEQRGRVAVIATTNRLEALDSAICRPGRFEHHILVSLPDRRGREAILHVYLKKMKTEGELPIGEWAARTEGYSGADLAALCRDAGMRAVLRGIAAEVAAADLAVWALDVHLALQRQQHQRTAEVARSR